MLRNVAVVTLLLCCARSVGAVEAESWTAAIDMAGRQRMLSQKMTKEFFLIANSIDTGAHKEKMQQSADLFSSSLLKLMNGDPTYSPPIPEASQAILSRFNDVDDIWQPFKQLLENSATNLPSMSAQERQDALTSVAETNVPVLAKSDAAVSAYVDSAAASGADVPSEVVNIAGRQRMLIQRVTKCVAQIALGIKVSDAVSELRTYTALFTESHIGIVRGSSWNSIPPLTKLCTLHKMRDVSYDWEIEQPIFGQVMEAATDSERIEIATDVLPNLVVTSNELAYYMQAAVDLYIHDDGSCEPAHDIPANEWDMLIRTTAAQNVLIQKSIRYLMQIALSVSVQDSKVGLTLALDQASVTMRDLVEGRRSKDVPAPPTQSIVNDFSQCGELWTRLEAELRNAIYSETVSELVVSKVESLGYDIGKYMKKAKQEIVELVVVENPAVSASLIQRLSEQKILVEGFGQESLLAMYGVHREENQHHVLHDIKTFENTHDALLVGGIAATNSSTAITKVTDLCVVRQMKIVKDACLIVKEIAISVAFNSTGADRMNDATYDCTKTLELSRDMYLTTSNPCDTPGFDQTAFVTTTTEWIAAINEIGKLRALTQEAVKALLLQDHTESVIDQIEKSVKAITYGDGTRDVPPAISEAALDVAFEIGAAWKQFHTKLIGSSASVVSEESGAFLTKVNVAKTLYADAAAVADDALPVVRMNLALDQLMLVQKMAWQALLLSGIDVQGRRLTTTGDLSKTISSYEANTRRIQELTHGGRDDIKNSMALADVQWVKYKAQILSISTALPAIAARTKMQNLLSSLVVELTEIVKMSVVVKPAPVETEVSTGFLVAQIGVPIMIILCPLVIGITIGLTS